MKMNQYLSIAIFLLLGSYCQGIPSTFTVELRGNEETCFYEPVKKDDHLAVDWQGMSEDNEEKNLIFSVIDPSGW
eukprot:Pgem_evm1s18275